VWPFRDAQAHIGFDLLIFGIHLFRMPVFFVMAGFFGALLYCRDGPRGFVHNRARRVLLPLVLFWALVIPLVVLGFLFALGQAGGDTGLVGRPQGPFLHQPILAHLWFLYGVFFAFGWLLHAHRDALDVYSARWKAVAAASICGSGLYLFVLAARPIDDLRLWTLASMALCALAIWPLVFAITGLFVRHMRTPRPIVRYVSDAAYWMYLVHLPLTVWIPGLLARSPLPAAAKFAIVLAATTLVTTVTYNYLVRSTVVGVLLNGRRYPRGLPKSAPGGQQVIV
jgi:fucose 4-O-acetylase-like acetyltransferase